MNKVFDVFISYRRSDGSDLAQQLFFYLSRKGIRAFLDKEKLMNGTYFDTQLREKLISAPHYVLIGTTDAFCDREGEDWVKEEIELAIEEYDRSEAIEPGERTSACFSSDGKRSQLPHKMKLQKSGMQTVLYY